MKTAAKRILVIGYNAFDVSIPVEQFPRVDSKLEVPMITLGGGGPAATAAVALSRLGARVHLLTPLTPDPGGKIQREELLAAGVNLEGCPTFADHSCARAVILVRPTTAERTVFWARGNLPHLETSLWDPRWLQGTDLLYVDGHEPKLSCLAAAEARSAGIPVVMDAGNVRQGSEELVALCTDVISSTRFAPDLTGFKDPLIALRALQERGPTRVAMTFGPGGVLAMDQEHFTVPAFEVPVVDTTGAGDVFHAGYAFARCQGGEFLDHLRFGAATAAIKCGHWGGRGGLPDQPAVQDLILDGRCLPLDPQISSL